MSKPQQQPKNLGKCSSVMCLRVFTEPGKPWA